MGEHRARWLLPMLGLASWVGYGVLARLRGWSQEADVWTFLATMAGLFALYALAMWRCHVDDWKVAAWPGGSSLPFLIFGAVLFRLALIPAGAPEGWSAVAQDLTQGVDEPSAYDSFMLYDNDVWRYLWDGRVMLGGVDTYSLSPLEIEDLADDGDPRFDWFEQEVWASMHPRIGYSHYRTIYPPLAQLTFMLSAILAPGSAAMLKLLLIVFDIGSCLLLVDLARRLFDRPALAMIYAWNPLVIKELAGSAHVDALMIFFLVLALWCLERGREKLALASLGGAILIKLTPLLLVPLFLKRTGWRHWWPLPVVGAVAYGPFIGSISKIVESLQAFAQDWAFNAGPWGFFLWLGQSLGAEGRGLADALSLLLTLTVVAVVTWRDRGSISRMASGIGWILGAYVLLSPTVMPWYLLWALPFLALGGRASRSGQEQTESFEEDILWTGAFWGLVTAASLCSYAIYFDGVEHLHWLVAEYAIIAAGGLGTILSLKSRRSGLYV